MNVETLKIVFNELYLRLTEYSRLVYSKHQSAPIEELKTAPQFSFSIKNLCINNSDIELILNFFACFENSLNSRYGIYYEGIKDEYTINTKSHVNAKVFETILWNCINNMSDDDLLKLHSIFSDKSKQQKIKNTFNNEVGVLFFLKEFKFQKIRTKIECFKKYYELYDAYNRQDSKERKIKNEQKRVEQENQLKEQVRQEIISNTIISNTQAKGGKKRNQKTNIIKLQVIQPLYLNKNLVKGSSVLERAKNIADLINQYCNRTIYVDGRIEELEKKLKNRALNQEAKNHLETDLSKFENERYPALKSAIENLCNKLKLQESVAINLVEYCKTKGEIQGQIYKWCLAIDKEAKK
jgi:hypothetical protein